MSKKCQIDKILEATAHHGHGNHEEIEFIAGLSPEAKGVYIRAEERAHDGAVNTFTGAMKEILCPGCRSKATCSA